MRINATIVSLAVLLVGPPFAISGAHDVGRFAQPADTRVAHSQSGNTRIALDGRWIATITTSNVADFKVRMTVHATKGGRFEAYSRPGALRQNVSWWRYVVGRTLGKLPPHLAAIRFDSVTVTPAADSGLVRGVFVSPALGTFRMTGALRHDTLRAELRRDSAGVAVGSVAVVRDNSTGPLRDYGAVARAIADTMRTYVFDARLMETPSWRSFFSDLAQRFNAATDDSDALIAFYALLPRLGTSHVNLTYNPALAAMNVDSALVQADAPPEALVTLTFPAPDVAYLYVRRWQGVSPVVDKAFARIAAARTKTLVLDIRGNPGGDQSSIALAGHLLSDTIWVGTLLGNGWYRNHSGPPTLRDLPDIATTSVDNLLNTFHLLRERGAVAARLVPSAPHFAGRVFLLINASSGSASEPFAYLLKQTKRATLIGEPTPGKVLAAVPHPVGKGWLLLLPEADYFAADGVRIEGRGVMPDIRTPWREAMSVVADSVRAGNAYAAALLAAFGELQGVTPETREARSVASERWAREALRLGPDSAAPIASLATAFIAANRWNAAFAVWDSLSAARPASPMLQYQLGLLAAVSGKRLDDGERALRAYLRTPPLSGLVTHATAELRLGMILEQKGDTAGARREYDNGLRLEPNNSPLKAALARLTSR